MRKLARWCFRHRFLTIALWLAVLVGLNGLHSLTGSAYTDNFKLSKTGSFQAMQLLARADPRASGETDQLVIAVSHGRVTDPAVRARAQRLFTRVAALPYVARVSSPYTAATARQIAPGQTIAFANVTFTGSHDKITASQARTFDRTITSASGGGVQFQAEGNVAESGNPTNQSTSLMFGFLAAGIVLFVVFGSLTAMALPLVSAGISLGSAIAVVGLLSNVLDVATFSNELALLFGLGVGVDYALFIVTRYRQALKRGTPREEAVVEAVDTSGRAVLFAGLIVCIAMLGMFALGVPFLYGVAVAGAVAVAFTVIAAVTLLPALLGVVGGLVPRRRERRAIRDRHFSDEHESRAWARWAGIMRRRPVPFAAAAVLVLVVIAIPFSSMRLGSADAGTDPLSTTTRQAYDLLAKGFGPGYNGPLQLVAQVHNPGQVAAFTRAERAVAHSPGVVGSTGVHIVGAGSGRPTVAVASVYPAGPPQAASTSDLLTRVRGHVLPAATRGTGLHVLVGGTTAVYADFSQVLTQKMPLFIGIVVAVSFLLLMAVFRSLAIPLTAAVMNTLSAAAAFGVVTAVFQNGWGASLLGISTTGPVEAFLPVLMFPVLFGLSMDYEVFLLSRIYEEWHRRGDNAEAVTHGLAATGRTISAAATIMVLVFASFVLGGQWIIDMFGVGLASAVLIDALVIRSLLVPAVMLILGKRNWSLPRRLDRVLPHFNVEGSRTNWEQLEEGLVAKPPTDREPVGV
ncbi:MAG TPA: MMPL family transporter [Solirubrobacteraceae bacterium]|nr:MMPL family transporter [Solirubrobacteraceae bacterium]